MAWASSSITTRRPHAGRVGYFRHVSGSSSIDGPSAGRPGFLHGGALSGLMEMAGIAALRAELARRGEAVVLKPVNVAVEFMRGGTEQRTFAAGVVTRAGRRVALVNAEAWQDDRTKPIALAQMKILLSPAE